MSLCLLGTIIGVHGIQGWVKLKLYSDIEDRLAKLDSVRIGKVESKTTVYAIQDSKESTGQVLAKLHSVDDRTLAETLIGLHLYISDEQMLPPPDGMYYIHELIGCEIIDARSKQKRGKVTDVMLLPANDVYVVDNNGIEVLIPAVPDFIEEVDVKEKRIIVNPVPGLFEDNDAD